MRPNSNHPLKWLKVSIWVYFVLIFLEGMLRKWLLPAFSDVIFVARDPVVLVIYLQAWRAGKLQWSLSLLVIWLLAFVSLLFALSADHSFIVTLFGLRTNYLHLPLIFVLGQTLDRDDVRRFGVFCLVCAVPITALMFVQYNAPSDAWVNIGAGGESNGQIIGALGRIRPPGPFSFIGGLVAFFGLTMAFILDAWLHPQRVPRAVLIAGTIALAIALPLSISRTLTLTLLVGAVFGFATVAQDRRRTLRYTGPLFLIAIVLLAADQLGLLEAFTTRWREATEADSGTVQGSIFARSFGDYLQAIDMAANAPWTGHGIGLGTVAGAKLASGQHQFLLAESEWSRIVLELGPIMGFAFIAWRIWIATVLVTRGWQHFRAEGDPMAWMLAGGSFLPLLQGQWGPATHLGFAVFGAGLALAAMNEPEDDEQNSAPALDDDMAPEHEAA